MNDFQIVSPLDAPGDALSLEKLAELSTLSVDELQELIEYGALVPIPSPTQVQAFSADWVRLLRSACDLRVDFDLDLFTVAMVLGYLQRIDSLARQVQTLSAELAARDRNEVVGST